MGFLIACVGKPSAGKSSFLNAVTDATAKVGNYPFTTIKPNHGVAYTRVDCPCKKFNVSEHCKPKYGKCTDGQRWVPIQILDVAGLVPGASKGAGLGNQFLNDLCSANALIHVVDVSGTTDEGGKETIGYDPSRDVEWLNGEIKDWIFGNLSKKWSSIVRRHVATKAFAADTLHNQLSGYGCSLPMVQKCLDIFEVKDQLEAWDEEVVAKFVNVFHSVRFPTVIALNKIDLPSSSKNIDKICQENDPNLVVLTSALAESFLRKLSKSNLIEYHEGTDAIYTAEDETYKDILKPMDDKTKARLEKVLDLVLFRYGSTGVADCIDRVVEVLGLLPAFPVKNFSFSGSGAKADGVFRDCIMVKEGTTVREFAGIVSPEIEKNYQYAERVGNIRLAEDEVLTKQNNIITFKTSALPNA